MRESLIANCLGENFYKGEKVIAFNFIEKNTLNATIKTFIKKYNSKDTLQNEETCKKINDRDYNIYNIGEYKVVGIIADYARIFFWEKEDNRK